MSALCMLRNKLLIIAPAWIGDLVMAQSLFKHLKLVDPHIEIHVIAPDWNFLLLQRMPEVSKSIKFTLQHGELSLLQRYKIGKSLQDDCYHQAIILPNSWKSALIPWFAKIAIRTGWLGEQRYWLLNDLRYLNKSLYTRMVERYVALAYPENSELPSKILYPNLLIDDKHLESVKLKFSLQKPHFSNPIVALCVGAAFGDAKCWPIDKFISLAYKAVENQFNVWVFGSIQNLNINNKNINVNNQKNNHNNHKLSHNIINFSGQTNLLEAIDLLSLVDVVVCNDSGLMHIAASLNKKIVAIYGATSEEFVHPLTDHYIVINKRLKCSPCYAKICPLKHHNCMQQISVEEVLEKVQLLCKK